MIPQPKLWLILLILPSCLHAAVTARVDQQTVYQGDKLTLTLEADRKIASSPSFQPLQNNFHIISSKQVTVSSHGTGTINAKTRWIIALRPLNEGLQQIPALQVAGEESMPITLQILPAKDNPTPNTDARQHYLEATLDNDQVHRNGQAILRIKVFHLNDLPLDGTLSFPRASNTLIKSLEEGNKYETKVKGRPYKVTEYSYALFPKRKGTVEIEPFFFSGTLSNRELLELTSPLLLLSVQPPVSGIAVENWLPAKDIFIEDNLADTLQFKSDSPLRRIISIHAEGLPASALPSLSTLQHDQAKIELINVVLEEQATANGFISMRTEELLITPQNTDRLTLPEIKKGWWNTQTNQELNAVIPQRILQVLPSTVAASETVEPEALSEDTQSGHLLIWILTAISLISTLGFIYSFNQIRNLRKNPDKTDKQQAAEEKRKQEYHSSMTELNTFQALAIACNQNNPVIAQARLVEWAQSFWETPNTFTLEEVCELANDPTFNYLIIDLEEHLYGHDGELWQGDLLLDGIERLRKRRHREQRKLNVQGNQFVMDPLPIK